MKIRTRLDWGGEVAYQFHNVPEHAEHRLMPKATQDGQIEAFDLEGLTEQNDDPSKGIYKNELEFFLHQKRIPLTEFYGTPDLYPEELFDLEDEGGCGDANCFT